MFHPRPPLNVGVLPRNPKRATMIPAINVLMPGGVAAHSLT